jgi:hypothetical protein
MGMCIGIVLLFSLISGGVYLYFKVQRLEQEIAKQSALVEGEDEGA